MWRGKFKKMDITVADIEQDIKNFKDRISATKNKLEMLPVGFLPYPQHKKREKQRRDLKAEINHVQGLIAIAQEALTAPPTPEVTEKPKVVAQVEDFIQKAVQAKHDPTFIPYSKAYQVGKKK